MAKRKGATDRDKKVRQRRSPEAARRLILESASALLIAHGPDAIGLKDVAARAGVSHALVSHYFGTKESLFEEAIELHSRALQDAVIVAMAKDNAFEVENLIALLFESIATPNAGRLAAWMLLSGRSESADFFPLRHKGGKRVVDVLSARFASVGRTIPRERIEFAMLLVLTAAHGYAMGRKAFLGSLELSPTKERDEWFRHELSEVVKNLARPD